MLRHSLLSIAFVLALGSNSYADPPIATTPKSMSASMPDSMSMSGMSMSSSIDLSDPMSREGSGTSWLPDSSPMYGKMWMKPSGDMLMLHGAMMPRYTDVGSNRGDRRVDAPSWLMGMYSHPLGEDAQLGLRAMMSLDPIMEGGWGYPLLFQTGETWHGQPLHDRQHPHDFIDELSGVYSRRLGGDSSAYLYLGYPGEPALGPPAYMHRLIAYDLADAPIGHHWQDATHITFGVATLGWGIGSKVKVETSAFNGREPNEDRYNFDPLRLDSQSGRLSYNPDKNDALQVSYGFVHNPEGDGASVDRTTASWIYNRPLQGDSNLTTNLVWGRNNVSGGEGITDSVLGEFDYQRASNTVFSRIEHIQKSAHELVIPSLPQTNKYWLGEYTLGYVHDLQHGQGIDTGIGAAVTLNTKPGALDPVYGGGSPFSFQVFLRLRPSREGIRRSSMKMADRDVVPSQTLPTPATPPSNAESIPNEPAEPSDAPSRPVTAAPISAVPAVVVPPTVTSILTSIVPTSPKARKDSTITVTLLDQNKQPVTGGLVTADITMTEMDMGTSRPKFVDVGNGIYTATVRFAMAGAWKVAVHAGLPGSAATVSATSAVTVVR